MNPEKQAGLVAAIKRWAAEGYTNAAVATALQLNRVTVAKWAAPDTQFGNRKLPVTWTKILGTELQVAPNLQGQYEVFRRHMDASPEWTIEQLLKMVRVSEETILVWHGDWWAKRRVRQRLGLRDYQYSRKWPK